jgi:hypothetical protein
LTRLTEIESDGRLDGKEDLKNIHTKLILELEQTLSRSAAVGYPYRYRLWKFLVAAAPWLSFSLSFVRGIWNKEADSGLALTACLLFGGVFGGIGIVIPELIWPWLNFVIYPIGHFLLFLGLFIAPKPKQSAQAT